MGELDNVPPKVKKNWRRSLPWIAWLFPKEIGAGGAITMAAITTLLVGLLARSGGFPNIFVPLSSAAMVWFCVGGAFLGIITGVALAHKTRDNPIGGLFVGGLLGLVAGFLVAAMWGFLHAVLAWVNLAWSDRSVHWMFAIAAVPSFLLSMLAADLTVGSNRRFTGGALLVVNLLWALAIAVTALQGLAVLIGFSADGYVGLLNTH